MPKEPSKKTVSDTANLSNWALGGIRQHPVSALLMPSVNLLESLIRSHFQTLSLDPAEHYRKIQVQAALFNLGIVLSLNSVPYLHMHAKHPEDPFTLSGDVATILGDRKFRWLRNTMPALYAVAFIRKFFEQLRGILCDEERRAKVEGESKFTLQGGAAAIAAWIAREFGIAEPIGIGIATFLVLALMAAAGDAFCQLSKDDLLRALGDDDQLAP
jgi:hypothetical protein